MGKQNKCKKLQKQIKELQSVYKENDPKKMAMMEMKKKGGLPRPERNKYGF